MIWKLDISKFTSVYKQLFEGISEKVHLLEWILLQRREGQSLLLRIRLLWKKKFKKQNYILKGEKSSKKYIKKKKSSAPILRQLDFSLDSFQ